MPKTQVRRATNEDLGEIVDIDRVVYSETGAPVYEEEIYREWMEVHPEGFLVATLEGKVIGHTFFVRDETDVSHPGTIPHDYVNSAKSVHVPGGRNAFVLNITASTRGAGGQLLQAISDFVMKEDLNCFYGGVRVPGLRDFATANKIDTSDQVIVYELAVSYMRQNAERTTTPIHPEFPDSGKTVCELERADPSMGSVLRGENWILLGCAEGYMPSDDESLNYAAIIAWINPNKEVIMGP